MIRFRSARRAQRRHWLLRLGILLTFASFLLAGCGGDGDDGNGSEPAADRAEGDAIVFAFEKVHWDSENPPHAAYPDEGRQEIAVVGPNGGPIRELTHTDVDEEEPAWSPNHSQVAYYFYGDDQGKPAAPGEGSYQIWVMNADGTDAHRVVDDGESPDWSPDGEQIVFVRDGDDPETADADLWVVDADGGEPEQLTHGLVSVRDPAWSPEGSKIAFEGVVDTRSKVYARVINLRHEIFIVDAEGGEPEQLTNFKFKGDETSSSGLDVGGAAEPAWSPDGKRIAFSKRNSGPISADDDTVTGIVIANADGSAPVRLTYGYDNDPTWSPVGRKIAFQGGGISDPQVLQTLDADDTSPLNGFGSKGRPTDLTHPAPESLPGRNVYLFHAPDW